MQKVSFAKVISLVSKMLSVFKNINQFAGKSKFLDSLAIFFARDVLYILLICLALFGLYAKSWSVFLYPLFSGLFAAFIINNTIYIFYKKNRPAELKSTTTLIPVPKNPSFPSRHSALLFGVSFALFSYSTVLAIIFIIASAGVGLARVFAGVHWFRDIIAGVLVGFLSSVIVGDIINYFV